MPPEPGPCGAPDPAELGESVAEPADPADPTEPADPAESVAESVFAALADPTRRDIVARLAGRVPISRQAITKHLDRLADAGLVTVEPGERRRIRHRVRSAPMRTAQRYLAALARDWDGPLAALSDHLDTQETQP